MVNTQKNDLFEVVERSWLGNFPDHFSFEVGLSGGIDSIVMFHIMWRLSQKYDFKLKAVHIHHGLQSQANEWVDFCTTICHGYNVPLRVEYVKVNINSPLGIEAEAREQRYDVFKKSKQSVVVLAHHRDDQIETFLLAMLRGGGLRGMVSMPVVRKLKPSNIFLWRPLLSSSKIQIEQYAINWCLKYIQDPSNASEDYTRNWIRKKLLPLIHSKIDFADEHILQNIVNLQETLHTIDELALYDYKNSVDKGKLSVKSLMKLSPSRAREALIRFLKEHDLGVPRQQSLYAFIDWMNSQPSDFYEWQLPKGKIYCYDEKIWEWADSNTLKQKLQTSYFSPLDVAWRECKRGIGKDFIHGDWFIRPMNKNDTIQTEVGVQSVLHLLKKSKIPRFIRSQWPVIVNTSDECVIVVGLRVDVRYQKYDGVVPYIKSLELYLK
ncbi:MAG: tRNA lysidine(34) synthetase TilS [Neisseriaceae bacterium]|nr:MAG: tRNA lysidine(34) synthetase TilS [Neisseriaceae bacterium]